MKSTRAQDLEFLQRAAKIALRGHGGAEPNPLVGCLVVSPKAEIIGWGYHRQCGTEHAEVHALRRAGSDARGATAYITLEPCNHDGRTPPCTRALIEAGVRRVVIARRDPNPIAQGGMEILHEAGIETDLVDGCELAKSITDHFVHRVQTGLPWIIAKWAQTLDGYVATRTGDSQWLSGPASRKMVHRQRGRVDAIITGIGTVRSDDPMLTARDVRRRRTAQRVVVDPSMSIPLESQLVQSAVEFPTIVACHEHALTGEPNQRKKLEAAGVVLLGVPGEGKELCLKSMLQKLSLDFDITTVLTEAGPNLLGRLLQQNLINDAWVFVTPRLFGDSTARSCIEGLSVDKLTEGREMQLLSQRRRGDDCILHYRFPTTDEH